MFRKILKTLNLTKPIEIGGREFKNKFYIHQSKEVQKDDFENDLKNIIKKKFVLIEHKQGESTRMFFESFENLFDRYIEVCMVEWEMYYWDKFDEAHKRNMSEIQMDLINKTESFHQKINALIGDLILLIKCSKDVKGMPKASPKQFIIFWSKKIKNQKNKEEILIDSIEYRGSYIEHNNKNLPNNWSTYSGPDGRSRIIYRQGTGMGRQQDLPELNDPILNKDSINSSKVFVPPHHRDTLKSFIDFTLDIFKII